MMLYENKCVGCGKCKIVCPNGLTSCGLCGKCVLYCPHDAREICGREYDVDEVMKEILKDKSFYEASGGGVTFSGGECMLQIDFLEEILRRCKLNGIHTAVDTAGNVPYRYFERILPYTDFFLYDIKCIDNVKHKYYTGVENILILENLQRLLEEERDVLIRVPVIPNVNDSADEMECIKRFLDCAKTPVKVELLPYHKLGEHKYAAIGRKVPDLVILSQKA
jgi:pyruvate formate lyase activating enzyme